MKPRLLMGVPVVHQEQQRLAKEDLFGLRLGNPVLVVLAGVSIVPIEAGDAFEVDHLVYDHHIRTEA
jgi:hypothetical protein